MTQPGASDTPLRLTEWTSCGGCAAKFGATLLSELVAELPNDSDSALLVGLAPFDDAAVYRLTDDIALVSTTDFFPPLVDDPDDFGAIAAANACSDVFAMGGEVVLAVNVAAFPEHFPREAIATIFAAASKVVTEAGGRIAGGHTIRNPEPIFGLAVQGVVHPQRIFRKSGARPGDRAVLSKPLGSGLVTAAGTDAEKKAAIAMMRTVNRGAAEALRRLGDDVHAVTDVTGYGLAGHGWEMADRSGVRFVVHADKLATYDGARRIAAEGEFTSHMATKAGLKALEQAHLAPEDVELIIVATITPDTLTPATACYVQENIGARRAIAFDVSAACSGFLYAMEIARDMASKSPIALRLAKEAARMTELMPLRDAYRYEQSNTVFLSKTEDAREAQLAFLEKRAPVYKGR